MTVMAGEFDYGFSSPHWMLKAMLMYVPRAQLNLGIAQMIDFMVYTEGEWGIQDAFQVLAQYALTGQYHPVNGTFEPSEDQEPQGSTPSEDDIERQVAEFGEFLKGLAEASDPMVDFKLDGDDPEDNREKEVQ